MLRRVFKLLKTMKCYNRFGGGIVLKYKSIRYKNTSMCTGTLWRPRISVPIGCQKASEFKVGNFK